MEKVEKAFAEGVAENRNLCRTCGLPGASNAHNAVLSPNHHAYDPCEPTDTDRAEPCDCCYGAEKMEDGMPCPFCAGPLHPGEDTDRAEPTMCVRHDAELSDEGLSEALESICDSTIDTGTNDAERWALFFNATFALLRQVRDSERRRVLGEARRALLALENITAAPGGNVAVARSILRELISKP